MIFCLNSSTIRPAPLLQKIRIAAECGYAAIELWHDDIDLFLQQGGSIRQVRQTIDDLGLVVPTTIMLKGWCTEEGPKRTQDLDECKRRLQQAADLGAIYAIAGPPLGMVDRALAARRYGELIELGLQFGVHPAMEYLGFAEDIKTIGDALSIAVQSGRPEACIVLDPFHCYRGGGGMDDIAALKPDQIAISHFNDAPESPPREQQHDPDRVMPGDGCLDLRRYVQLLRDSGYQRWISLELFRHDLWKQDPRKVAQLGLEKMRAVVEG